MKLTKYVDAACITTTDQVILQQDNVAINHLVVLANQKSGFSQLQKLNFAARQVCTRVKKWPASLFKLYRSILRDEVGDFVAHITVALRR